MREIRALGPDNSLSYVEIGARFGIEGPRAASIIAGHSWKDPSYIPPQRKVRNKLGWPQVREIRRRYAEGETGSKLAREFKVSAVSIHFITSGHHWRRDPLGLVYEPATHGRGGYLEQAA